MKPLSQQHYENIIRWDSTALKYPKCSKDVSKLDKMVLLLHENTQKHSKEKYILALCLELLTGQRTSPTILSEGTYKKSVTYTKKDKLPLAQVTLRKKSLFHFLDKVIFATPEETLLKGFTKRNVYCSDSFYLFSPNVFRECSNLSLHLRKVGPLQVHVTTVGKFSHKTHFGAYQLPVASI